MKETENGIAFCCAAGTSQLSSLQESGVITAVNAVICVNKSSCSRPTGHYLRGGSIPLIKKSVWYLRDKKGDDLEFLTFTSLTRGSFNALECLCKAYIKMNTIQQSRRQRNKRH